MPEVTPERLDYIEDCARRTHWLDDGNGNRTLVEASREDVRDLCAEFCRLTADLESARAEVVRLAARPTLTYKQALFLMNELAEHGEIYTWAIQAREPIPTLYRETLAAIRAIVSSTTEVDADG